MEKDAEKMLALKRAYADIILNTSKESAARILAAERRALGFQQSLFAAKEEAVATMLRLKAVMEGKIKEVEKAARCQEKKIEELELQLGEAEDTIVDLREELKRVREELTMMKDVPIQQLSGEYINDTEMTCNNPVKDADNLDEPGNGSTICDNNITTMSQKIADTHQFHLQNVAIAEYPKEFSIRSFNGPELYRNGYTQGLYALEHNLTLKPFGEINGLHSCSKFEPHTCTAEKLEIASKIDSPSSVKRSIEVKDAVLFEEDFCSTQESGQVLACDGEDHINFFSKVSPLKQGALYDQSSTFLDGIYMSYPLSHGILPDTDKYTSYTFSDGMLPHTEKYKSYTLSGGMLPHTDKYKSYALSDGILPDNYKPRSSKVMLPVHDEQNETESSKETSSPSISVSTETNSVEEKSNGGDASTSILSRCKLDPSVMKERKGIKPCTERITWDSVKKKQNQSVFKNTYMQDFLLSSEDARNSLLLRTSSKTDGHSSSKSGQKELEDVIEVGVASREEGENVAENLDSCITVKPDTNNLATRTAQAGTDKFLKYTFHRKRKRGCSSIKNEIVFPEKKLTLKPKSMDKQTSLPVPSKSIAVTDLPRNNRRIVQVARQLISLSEKRW